MGTLALAAAPAALTLYLSFRSGGFFVGATSLAAAEMAIVVAARLLLARRPFASLSIPLAVALVALGGFAGWVLLSADWSHSEARALPEYARALFYVLVLGFFGLFPFDARRIRWMLYGLVAAIVVVAGFAMTARLLPHVIYDPALEQHSYRLGYPLTYWNALGLLCGIGLILSGHLSCSSREPAIARVAGAAAVPLLVLTLFYTFSRGASWATGAALLVYLVVGRPRALVSGALAAVPAAAILIMEANPTDSLTDGPQLGQTQIDAGHHMLAVLLACIAGAAIVRICLLPLDGVLARLRLPDRVRLPALAGGAAAGIAVVVLAALAVHAPGRIDSKYDEFVNGNDKSPGGGAGRLLSASTNGRKKHWDVAMAAFRRDPVQGAGAGTFAILWLKGRTNTVNVRNAHSLYVETLGELGVVGLGLLLVALVSILGAFAYRARGPDRTLFAALLAAGVCWAIAAGVDWDWQMPATGIWLFAFGGAALARSPRKDQVQPARHWGWSLVARGLPAAACLALAVLPLRLTVAAADYTEALSAMKDGNCRAAEQHARDAISAEGERASPRALIAFCEIRAERYERALPPLRAALARDPENWELFYNLAVARGGLGRNPVAAARRAAALNPQSDLAAAAVRRFAGDKPARWKHEARETPLVPPGPSDP